MRRVLTGAVLVVVAVGWQLSLSIDTASADAKCQQTSPATGVCLVWVEVPDPNPTPAPTNGTDDTGSGASCYWDPDKQGVKSPPAGPVACSSYAGYWSNAYNCYISPAKPQPPAGDPSWQGHQVGDGAVYHCYQPQTEILINVWAQDPPAGAAAGPSPRDVAQLAVARMGLRAIDIGIAPRPGPDSVGIVGMPVWMWAAAPDNHTYGPISASASAGGITITATARVERVTWSMGDGTVVVCRSAGTPYKPSYGRKESPDCGHIYQTTSADEPRERFTVTATSQWVVTWSGAGQTGTIRLDGLTRSTQITIGEAQVLVD